MFRMLTILQRGRGRRRHSLARPAATATSSLRLSDLAAPVHHQVETLRRAVVRVLEKRRHVLRDLDRSLRLVDS